MASVGATVGTSTTCPSSVMIEMPVPRPMIAVMIGMPIATTVPKVKSSTMIAIAMPTTSLDSTAGCDSSSPT